MEELDAASSAPGLDLHSLVSDVVVYVGPFTLVLLMIVGSVLVVGLIAARPKESQGFWLKAAFLLAMCFGGVLLLWGSFENYRADVGWRVVGERQDDIIILNNELRKQGEAIDELVHGQNELIADNQELIADNQNLTRNLSKAKEEISWFKGENRRLSNQVEGLQTENEGFHSEIENLKSAVGVEERKSDQARREVDVHRQEAAQSDAEAAALRNFSIQRTTAQMLACRSVSSACAAKVAAKMDGLMDEFVRCALPPQSTRSFVYQDSMKDKRPSFHKKLSVDKVFASKGIYLDLCDPELNTGDAETTVDGVVGSLEGN